MVYKILFIDEEKQAHRSFKKDFLDKNKDRFSGFFDYPLPTLDEMMEKIYEINPDVLLTDFSLNDFKNDLPSPYTVEYNGGDIAREMLSRRRNFPVFIATSLGDDAAKEGYDVKLIYEKYGSFRENSTEDQSPLDAQHLSFADKIYYEALSYKQSLERISFEFDSLLQKRNSSSLSLAEEEQLLELDEILEASIDSRSKLPDELRKTSNIRRLDRLLVMAEQIINIKR